MLRNFLDAHYQHWVSYAPTLTHVYNSHLYHSTNTRPFDVVLNRRIPYFTLESTISTEKTFTAAEQRAGFPATPQH